MQIKGKRVVFYTTLIVFVSFILFPFFIMLMVAFKPTAEALAYPPKILPQIITFEHFKDVFNPKIFPYTTYFLNSLYVSLIASSVSVFVAIFGAYSLARFNLKGKVIISQSFYFVYLFSGMLLVVPLYKMLTSLGIINTLLALTITMIVQTLPTCIFMLKSYFDTLPEEIEEAALLDGLNKVQIVFKIIIPLAISGIIPVFVYAFMVVWNDYIFASILLSSPNLFTFPIGLNTLFSTPDYVWGRMMVAALVSSLPVIILYALSERFIKSGLTDGGVKG